MKPVAITLTYSGLLYLRFQEYSSDERALTKMLLLDIGIGCLFFAILVGGLSAFRDFALSLQFGSNLFFVWVASFVLEGSPSIKKTCALIIIW